MLIFTFGFGVEVGNNNHVDIEERVWCSTCNCVGLGSGKHPAAECEPVSSQLKCSKRAKSRKSWCFDSAQIKVCLACGSDCFISKQKEKKKKSTWKQKALRARR